MNKRNKTFYPPIRNYGYIADCHSSAVVSISGSIDWCCMPRLDSGSCFGRLLDWEKGGYCQIVPKSACMTSRRYLQYALVLETTFRTPHGEACLLDCFTMRKGGKHTLYRQILRVIEGIKGGIEFIVEIVPFFDYGTTKAWIRSYKRDHYIAIGGNDGLLLSTDFHCNLIDRHSVSGSCTVEQGQRTQLFIFYRQPEDLDEGLVEAPPIKELDRRLDETVTWWHSWSAKGTLKEPY